MKEFHFISGLPRSGSTLLSAILRQNPRFCAGVSSPLAALINSVRPLMSGGEFVSSFDDDRRADVMRSVAEGFYRREGAGVIFDTSRTWAGQAPLVGALFPASKIICCVRDVLWILDSIERILQENPLRLSGLFNFQAMPTVYSRVDALMNPNSGLVGQAWRGLREAWFGPNASRLIIVRYDSLVRAPKETMARIYSELGEQSFAHDFDNVIYDEGGYDEVLGTPGLHRVRKKVEFLERESMLPPEILAKMGNLSFWGFPDQNRMGVPVV